MDIASKSGRRFIDGLRAQAHQTQDKMPAASSEPNQNHGDTVQAVDRALQPLALSGPDSEQTLADLKAELVVKLQHVPSSEIISPEPRMVGPAIEALRWGGSNTAIRPLYYNLIASSMAGSTAPQAHPAFVAMLGQLHGDEVSLLDWFNGNRPRSAYPFITLEVKHAAYEDNTPIYDLFTTFSDEAGCADPLRMAVYITNLCRLGLAEIHHQSCFADARIYAPLLRHPLIRETIRVLLEQRPEWTFDFKRGTIRITAFGWTFMACCFDGV